MNIKELMTNTELVNSIVEDIEDIPEDSEVTYEVWALGYDIDEEPTDCEYFIGTFTDPDEAIKQAEAFTLDAFKENYENPSFSTVNLSIEVETVVEDLDGSGTMNIGTIYRKQIPLYKSDEAEEYIDPIVAITTGDYTLLDDGTLKIRRDMLKGFNKNDYIKLQFVDEPDVSILTYKIISTVIYTDGEYFHCEFIG